MAVFFTDEDRGTALPTFSTGFPATHADGRRLMEELTWGRKCSFPQDGSQVPTPNPIRQILARKRNKAVWQCKAWVSPAAKGKGNDFVKYFK